MLENMKYEIKTIYSNLKQKLATNMGILWIL